MLHNVFRVSHLLLMFVIFACDEGQKMVESVIPTPAENTEQITPEETESEILEITFANALDLQPGIYRLKPSSYGEAGEGNTDFIIDLWWGNVGAWGDLIEGYPADTPKILVSIQLNPQPYSKQIDGRLTIEYDPVVDEILVEIVKKLRTGTEKGGPRDNRYDYTYVVYEGKALENLTRPNRKFEYDE